MFCHSYHTGSLCWHNGQGVLQLQIVTRNWSIPVASTADGQSDCVTNSSFLAAATSGLVAKVAVGLTVAGVTGTAAAEAHSNCAANGGVGCVTVSAYPAAKLTNFTAANIQSGVTVAGIAGSLGNCKIDGATNCVEVTVFSAVATSGLASKVLSGSSVAGVTGNVTLPNPANVRVTNGNFGVGGTGIRFKADPHL